MYSMLVESATAVLWRLLDDKSQVNKMVIDAVSIMYVYHTYMCVCDLWLLVLEEKKLVLCRINIFM